MQRVLEIAQLCFYLTGMLVLLWVGAEITTRLTRLDREMERTAVVHDQLLKDHLHALKDHERLMQSR